MTKPWELITREHKGLVGRRAVVEKTFRLPDGREAAFMVTGDAANRAVACIAVTTRQTVLIGGQYRPGPERIMAELPGGAVEPGESLAEGAARELIEETGYVPEKLTYLGEMCYDAFFGMVWHYFLATGCELRREQELDAKQFVPDARSRRTRTIQGRPRLSGTRMERWGQVITTSNLC